MLPLVTASLKKHKAWTVLVQFITLPKTMFYIRRKNVALLRISQSVLIQSLTTGKFEIQYIDFSLVFEENVVLRRCESKTKVDVFILKFV